MLTQLGLEKRRTPATKHLRVNPSSPKIEPAIKKARNDGFFKVVMTAFALVILMFVLFSAFQPKKRFPDRPPLHVITKHKKKEDIHVHKQITTNELDIIDGIIVGSQSSQHNMDDATHNNHLEMANNHNDNDNESNNRDDDIPLIELHEEEEEEEEQEENQNDDDERADAEEKEEEEEEIIAHDFKFAEEIEKKLKPKKVRHAKYELPLDVEFEVEAEDEEDSAEFESDFLSDFDGPLPPKSQHLIFDDYNDNDNDNVNNDMDRDDNHNDNNRKRTQFLNDFWSLYSNDDKNGIKKSRITVLRSSNLPSLDNTGKVYFMNYIFSPYFEMMSIFLLTEEYLNPEHGLHAWVSKRRKRDEIPDAYKNIRRTIFKNYKTVDPPFACVFKFKMGSDEGSGGHVGGHSQQHIFISKVDFVPNNTTRDRYVNYGTEILRCAVPIKEMKQLHQHMIDIDNALGDDVADANDDDEDEDDAEDELDNNDEETLIVDGDSVSGTASTKRKSEDEMLHVFPWYEKDVRFEFLFTQNWQQLLDIGMSDADNDNGDDGDEDDDDNGNDDAIDEHMNTNVTQFVNDKQLVHIKLSFVIGDRSGIHLLTKNDPLILDKANQRRFLTLCMPPISEPLPFIAENVFHHLSIGIEHIYIGTFFPHSKREEYRQRLLDRLQYFYDAGLVTIWPHEQPFIGFTDKAKSHWLNQCLYYAKDRDAYTLSLDADEFLLFTEMENAMNAHLAKNVTVSVMKDNINAYNDAQQNGDQYKKTMDESGKRALINSFSPNAIQILKAKVEEMNEEKGGEGEAEHKNGHNKKNNEKHNHWCWLTISSHQTWKLTDAKSPWVVQRFSGREMKAQLTWSKAIWNNKHLWFTGYHAGGACTAQKHNWNLVVNDWRESIDSKHVYRWNAVTEAKLFHFYNCRRVRIEPRDKNLRSPWSKTIIDRTLPDKYFRFYEMEQFFERNNIPPSYPDEEFDVMFTSYYKTHYGSGEPQTDWKEK